MNWDSFQREALAELGHRLYRVQPSHAVDDTMLATLARATGLGFDALRDHVEIGAATSKLRGNAAAKRALWPRLRAMRAAVRAR